MKIRKEEKMNKDKLRQITIVFTTIITITINILANALPFNGMNTGTISDNFKVFFVPAGYVFSIWGIIYIALIAFMVYQALPAQRENPTLRKIGGWYLLGSLANSVWIFLWHYLQFNLTIIAMTMLLVSLIATYLLLDIGKSKPSAGMRWFVHVPFSIYLGWITVATIANVTDVLDFNKWGGWGIAPETWAMIMLAVAVVVAGLMALLRRDIAYLAVLVWAFAGIGQKFMGVSPVSTAGFIAAGATLVFLLLSLLLRQNRQLVRSVK
jgi:hypothetical protein